MKTQREWLDEVHKAFPEYWEQAFLDKHPELPRLSSFPTVSHVVIDDVGVEPDEFTRMTLTVEVDGKQFLMSGRHQDPEEVEDFEKMVWEFADAPTPELKAFASEFGSLFFDVVFGEDGTALLDWNELPPG